MDVVHFLNGVVKTLLLRDWMFILVHSGLELC